MLDDVVQDFNILVMHCHSKKTTLELNCPDLPSNFNCEHAADLAKQHYINFIAFETQ